MITGVQSYGLTEGLDSCDKTNIIFLKGNENTSRVDLRRLHFTGACFI